MARDEHEQGSAPGAEAHAGGALALPGGPGTERADGSQIWLLTFTDLVALLITFFVMLFAMSHVEERKWENLTQALSNNLNQVREVTVALPSEQLDIDSVETAPGVNLDYLASLLHQNMSEEATLADGLLRRLDDRLVLSLPGNLLFASGIAELGDDGSRAVRAVGQLLRHVDNRVEVIGSADPVPPGPDFPTNWELSLARAVSVARLLRDAGYAGEILTRGFGDARFPYISPDFVETRRRALARRVDVVIFDDAGEIE